MSPPDPLAAKVRSPTLDLHERTVTVMPADTGLAALLWRRGSQTMAEEERRGGYGGQGVWADALRRPQAARGVPRG